MNWPWSKLDHPQSYVFVVTYGRSGSTLLQKLLNGIPGFHVTGENLAGVFALAEGHRRLTEAKSRFGKHRSCDLPWFGAGRIDHTALGREIATSIIKDVIAPPRGTRVAGFKEIRWQTDGYFDSAIEFLLTYMTPAKFIVNVRDPQAVANSGWWRDRPREPTIKKISEWKEQLESFASEHQNALLLRYEDYTSDPSSLRDLFTFLGEPYDPALVTRVLNEKLTHMVR